MGVDGWVASFVGAGRLAGGWVGGRDVCELDSGREHLATSLHQVVSRYSDWSFRVRVCAGDRCLVFVVLLCSFC